MFKSQTTFLFQGKDTYQTMQYAVEALHLTKKYPRHNDIWSLLRSPFGRKSTVTALRDVTLKVRKGKVFCLLGPNGAGKTTLIKILCTLVLPTEGRGMVNGYNVVDAPNMVRKGIGYIISDERSFYWRLNAYQNLRFFGILNNIPTPELDDRIQQVLALAGLEERATFLFKDFSQGQKQKMAIARAFLTDPDILFMDEPTHGLDPTSANSLRRFIADEIRGRLKKTVIIATHNLKEAEEIGDRIAIIHEGKIRACGTFSELHKNIIKDRDRYQIALKPIPPGFIEGVRQKFSGKLDIKMTTEASDVSTVGMEITLDKQAGPEVWEIIESIVAMGGRIAGCYKVDIPLYEIYSQYTQEAVTET